MRRLYTELSHAVVDFLVGIIYAVPDGRLTEDTLIEIVPRPTLHPLSHTVDHTASEATR